MQFHICSQMKNRVVKISDYLLMQIQTLVTNISLYTSSRFARVTSAFLPRTSRLLTLRSWPVCDCGWLSCHKLKNPRSPESTVPPAQRSPLAADASWRVVSLLYGKDTNARSSCLLNTHTTPQKKLSEDADVRVRVGAFIPRSPPLWPRSVPTHPPLHSLTVFP